jgi:REP-associated tyrosine transposase
MGWFILSMALPPLIEKLQISESKVLAQDAEKVILCICDYYMVSRSDLLISKRGTENLPRDIAIFLVRRLCRLTLPREGKEFGINNYSIVSSVVQRVTLRIEKDKYLQREVDDVRKKMLKSQKRT